jgi:flagellar basal body-associated protein FliL
MSKGCLVALIVVGILVIMVAIAMITCWMKKDDLVKYGVTKLVAGIAEMAHEDPQPGVDPEALKDLSVAFEERVNELDSINFEKFGIMAQRLQPIVQDGTVDSAEARQVYEAVFHLFPDMREQYAPPDMYEFDTDDELWPEDTLMSEGM